MGSFAFQETIVTQAFLDDIDYKIGDRGGTVIKVLCNKSEGCWFDPRRCQ